VSGIVEAGVQEHGGCIWSTKPKTNSTSLNFGFSCENPSGVMNKMYMVSIMQPLT
jgi:hypothetical protein